MAKLVRYVALLSEYNLLDYSFNPGAVSLNGSDVVQQDGGGLYLLNNPLSPLFSGMGDHFNYGSPSNATNATNATNPGTQINNSDISNKNNTSPHIYLNTQAVGGASRGHEDGQMPRASSGDAAGKPHTPPFALAPADANPAPVTHIPGTVLRITEDAAVKTIHGISVSVADANSEITVHLSVAHGTLGVSTTLSSRLTEAGISGLTNAGIQGQGTNTLILTGTATAINATLTTLTYTVTPDYNGSDTLTVSSSVGNTPAEGSSGTMAIDVAAVNDAPTLAGIPAGTQSIITNQAAALADFRVDGADAANPPLNPSLLTLFVTLTPTGGSIGGFTDGSVDGLLTHLEGNTVHLTGTAALINAALAAATFTASGAGAASMAVSVSNVALGDSTSAASGTYNFMAYAAPTLNLPNGRNSFVNASHNTLDVEVAFANLLAGDTVQLKLGTENLGGVHTITQSEAQANKLSLTVNKPDLGADGSKTLTALITQGNISQAALTSAVNLTLDTAAPTLAITSSATSVKAGETATITFTFSEEPTDFDSSVIVVTGGTLGALSGTGTTRTATFTPTPDTDSTTASISVEGGENSYTDAAGNFGNAGSTPTLTVDTKAPTLAITSSVSAVKAGETATITFTFSEEPTGFDSSDITVTGGTLGTLSGNGTTRTATFTPTANIDSTTASITVAANGYTDAAGNNGGAGSTPTLTVDTTAPTLVITSSATAVKAGETATITFTFSEAPTDFDSSDIVVTGGTLGTLSGNGATRTATFTPTPGIDSTTASITVAANGYTDAAGNNGGAGTTPTLTVDTTAPTLVITSSVSAVKAGETATITFTFSETPTGFDNSDIVVTGGTLGTLSGNGTTRTATFTPTTNADSTTASITVAANGYTDAAGNNGGAGTTPTLTVDTTAPTLVITSSVSAVKVGETATITFTFSEAPTDFDSSDIVTTGGTLGTLSGTGTTRTATFTPTANIDSTAASITVAANGYTDAAGNNGGAGTTPTLTVDTTAPTLVITSSVSAVKAGETATITFTFSEAPTDFDGSDIVTTGGTLGTLTGNGTTRTATFTPTANTDSTTASITVAANGYTDAAGNSGGAGTTPMLTVDTTAPTLAITSSVSAVKAGETATITFTFSETPTDFDSSDIVVTGGTLGTLSGNGTTRTATFTPTANIDSTTASITVAANGYTDAAGNSGGAGTTPMLTVDTTAPTLVITSSATAVKAGETATITFTFSETPTGFDSSDITVTGGTLGTLSGSGTTRTATFTPTPGIDSTAASITVAANGYTDAAGNSGGAGTTPTLTVDTKAPTLAITSSVSAVKAGETATITFTFSEAPTGFDSSDITVTGGTLGTLSGSGTTRTATFTPTANTDSTAASITVAANGYTDAAGNNGGAGTTPTLIVDTTAPTLVITSSTTAVKVGETATITFTFSEAPTGFDSSDIVVTGGTLGTLTGSGTTRTATFTPTANTDSTAASITVAANGYTDAAGNNGGAGTTPTLTVDTTAPTLVITSSVSAVKVGETATITFTFSEAPTGFDSSDITVTGGTLGTLSGSGTTRTATFTPTPGIDSTAASITVAANGYTDAAGNNGGAGSTPTLTVDTTAPTLTITSDKSALKKGETATITFTFSEDPGSSFIASDITLPSGGQISGLTTTGAVRTAIFTPTDDVNAGSASISVASGTFTDAAGNDGTGASASTINFDTMAPAAPTLATGAGVSNGATAAEATATTGVVTVNAESGSRVLVTFTDSDSPAHSFVRTLTGTGSAQAVTLASTDLGTGAASLLDGTITVSAVATDAAGNTSTAGTGTFTLDTVAPTLTTITSDKSALKKGETATITFTFSEAPTDFDSSDITVTGGTLGTLSGSGTTRTATFTPTDDVNAGSASISVASGTFTDAAGNPGTGASASTINFDTMAPAAPTLATGAGVSNGATAAEATASTGVVTVNAESGSRVLVTFTDSASPTVHSVVKTATGTGAAMAVTLASTDLGTGAASLLDGTITVSAVATDAAGNTSTAGTGTFTLDTVAPTLTTISSDKSALKKGETATITFTFSEDPGSSFIASDITLPSGGQISGLTTTGAVRTATFTPTDDVNAGSASISVANGTFTDAAGNNGTGASALSISFDTMAPATPSLAPDAGVSGGATAAEATASTGVVTVNAESGSRVLVTFTDSDSPAHSVVKTATGTGAAQAVTLASTDLGTGAAKLLDGTITVSATATDVAGNTSTAGTGTFTLDTVAPALTAISSDKSALKKGETATITFTFSEDPGSSFIASDITLPSGGQISGLTTTGTTRTATFTPTDDINAGSASISVANGTFTDAAGNDGTGASASTINFDTMAPAAPTLATGAGVSNGATAAEATASTGVVTVHAESGSRVLVTFTDSAATPHSFVRTLTGTGAAQAVTLASTDLGTGAASLLDGTITVSATATDVAGNTSTAGTGTFTLDTVAPTLTTISSDKSALKKGETATITFTFSEDPGSSFIASDITLPSGGQISGLTTTGTTRTATFTPTDDVNAGSASISVASGTFTDAAGNDGTGASALSISFDTKIPTLTSASLQDTTALTLTFDSALDSGAFTDITSAQINSLFSFKTSGSSGGTYTTVSNAFTAIAVSGSTVTLTLGNTAYTTGQFAKISYTDTDTASDQTTRVVQDVAGNDLASFTDTAVITSPVILGFAVSDTVSSNGMALGKGGEAVSVVVTFSESVTLTASSTYTVHVQIGSNASDGFDATFAPASATAASSYTFQGTLPSTPGLSTSDLQITLLTVPDGASIINAAAQALTETTYMLHSSGYTVDTAAPLAPSVGLAVDSGSSNSDGISSNANVNVTLAEAGGTWQFSTDSGSTWSTGNGSSFPLASNQTYAAGSIKVRQTDAAGNVGAIGGITTALTLDTAPPSAPTSVALAADTGSSSTDGITKNAQVNVTLAEAGGSWQFSIDGGSTWTTGSGSSFMLATDQTYAAGSIQVRQTDAAGNVGASAGITTALTLDTAAPLAPTVALDVDTGSSSTDGITSNRNVNVTLAEAGGTWQFSTDSGSTWTTGNGSSFMLAANQTYAAGSIKVRQTDAAGNVGAIGGITTALTLDTAPPSAPTSVALAADTGSSSTDGITKNAQVNVTLAEAGGTWQFSIDGGGTWSTGNGAFFMLTADQTYAANAIQVRQTDAAGNVGASAGITTALTLDTAAPLAPTVALDVDTGSSSTDGITSNRNVNVTLAEAGGTWQFSTDSGGTWTTGSSSSFMLAANQTYAANAIQVRQTDAAGNVGAMRGNATAVTVDTTVPTFSSLTAAPDFAENTATAMAVYTAMASDTGTVTGTVTYSLKAGTGDAALFNININSGVVTFKASPNYEAGKHSYGFSVIATDAAGNTNEQAVTANLTDVNEAPKVKATAPESVIFFIGSSTDSLNLDEVFTDEDAGDTLTYSLSSGTLPSGLTLASGVISGTPAAGATGGSVTLTASDGHSHMVSTTLRIDVSTRPRVSSISVSDSGSGAMGETGKSGDTVLLDVTLSETVTFTGTPSSTNLVPGFSAGAGGAALTGISFVNHTTVDGKTVLHFTGTLPGGNAGSVVLTSLVISGGLVLTGSVSNQTMLASQTGLGLSDSYTLDNSPPAAPTGVALAADTGSSSTDGITKNAQVNVTLAEAGGTWQFSTNGGSTWTTGSGSSFMLTADQTYAANTIQVRQTDAAGNVGASAGITTALTLDTAAPLAPTVALDVDTGSSSTDGITSNRNVNVTLAEAGGTWQFSTDSGGTWTTGSSSSFMLAANQTYAANAIQVRQTDAAGNVGAMRGNATAVTVDTTVPTFSSLTAAPDFAENTATAMAVYTAMASDTGTVTGTVTYSLKAGTGDAALFNININSGVVTFKTSPNYEAGKHSYGFSVIATDAAGNTNEQTVTANLTDVNEAPKVKATAPESVIFFIGSSTDSLNLDEVFTDEDAGDTLTYSLSSGTLPSGLTLASGVISGTPAAGATGGSVTLTASDGHSHMVSTTLRIDVSTRPRVSSISVSDSGSGAMGETGKSGDTVLLDVTLSETVTFTGTPSSTNLVPGFSAGAGGAALTGISFVNHTTVDGKTVLHFTGTLPGGNAGSVVLTSLVISGGLVLTGSVSNQTMLASQTGLGLSDSYALDNSPPAAPTGVALAADTGSSSTDGITKNAQVNVTLAEAGGTWQFSTNGGSTWTTGNGSSFMLTADQTYAANAIQVRQTDAAGNVGASAGITTALTLDTTAPSLSDTPTLALMHGNAAASASLVAGDTIVLTIPLGEAATRLAGLPGAASTNGTVITLGGSAKAGAIWSTSGSNLLLTYTVVPGDSGAISVDATALKTALGNSITDTAGNLATLGGGVWGSNSFTAPAAPALTVSAPSLPTVSSFAVSDLVAANGANLGKGGELVQVEVTFSDTVTLTANKTYTVHVKVGTGSEGFDAVLDTTASGLNPATHYTFSGNLPSTAGLSTSALQLTLLTVPSGASILNTTAQALTETTYTLRSNVYTVDTSPPTLAISSSVSAVKAGQTATITFAFSEDPGSSFDSSDIVATGGSISGLSTTGTTRTATFTPTANIDSTAANITVAANGYTDAAGNSGGAGTAPTLTVDTKVPTLTITSDRTALKKGETASITFTFSEDPGSSFNWDGSMGDVSVTGGTLGSLSSSSGAVRTATFTPTDGTNAGSASISVATGTFNDAAGNNGTGGSAPAIGFDTLAPVAPGFSPNANATVRIASVTAAGEFNNFADNGISIGRNSDGTYSVYDGATVAGSGVLANGSHLSYQGLRDFIFNRLDETVTFDSFSTEIGNLAIPGKTYVVDVTAESGSSVLITLTDSASPTTHSFIKTVIGTGSALAVTLDSADVTGAAVLQDGTITISAVATDAAGNASSAGTGSFRLDTTDPTVTSIAFAGESETVYAVLNAGDTLDVAVTFSEDVTITGSPRVALTIGSSTGYATFDDSIAGTTDRKKFFRYTVAAGDADANGVSIAANALGLNSGANPATIKDAAGNVTKLGHALVADNTSYRIDTNPSWTPTFTLGAGVSGGATAAEATAATGVVSLVAKNDSTVVVSFTGANGTVVAKTLHGERSISDVLANSPYDVGVGQVNFMVRNFNGSYQIERRNRDTGAVESFSETLDFETFLGQMLNIYGANEEPIRVAVRSLASNGAVVLTADDVAALGQGTVTVSATATDAAGHVSTAGTSSFTLDTTAPTFASATVTATSAENVATSTVIHTALATDAGGGTIRYSIKDGVADASAVTINNSTGAVTLKASPDFETKASYSFTVIATDAAGNTAEQTVSLSITDVAETVTLTSSLVGNSDKALDVTSDLVFGVGVGSTGFTGTLAGVAGKTITITDNGHLGTPAADTGYAGEDENHTFTIPVLIDGALNPLITISGSGANTKITISPDANFDFDLSANYTIDIPAGAFVSGTTSSLAMSVSFNTVTPGTVAATAPADADGHIPGSFTGNQAYRMNSSGGLDAGNKWVDINDLGDSGGDDVSLDLADGNYTVVMPDSLDEATDIDSGTTGIAPTTDLAVLLKNFGTTDRIYVDDPFHDGTKLNQPTQLVPSGSGTTASPFDITLDQPASSNTGPYINIVFASGAINGSLTDPNSPTVAMWNSMLFSSAELNNPYNSLIISG